jgi:phosphohistidine phosphatase
MDLILWRHAEAEDHAANDLARQLTMRGAKHALAAAKWLRSRIDSDAVFLVSPAARTVQTAEAFGDQYRTVRDLEPGASARAVLEAAKWPEGVANTVIVVGHQPTLGRVAALLMTGHEAEWPIKKAGIWWFQGRSRAGDDQVVLKAVINPDLL